MKNRLTLYDLGLTVNDFIYEFIDFADDLTYHPLSFTPTRSLIAKVNGVKCIIKTNVNVELARDIEAATGLNGMREVKKLLKEEAINWFINNNQFIRQQKLLKIKEKYGI